MKRMFKQQTKAIGGQLSLSLTPGFTSLQRRLVSVMTSVEEEKLNTNNSINPAVGVASATGCSTFISFFATAL